MNNKPIKEYEDFTGEAGYLIVDSLTNETSGGKMKVPNYQGVTDGYVLTKTSDSGTDEVVWAQAGGSGITSTVYPLVIPAGYNDKIELEYDSNTLGLNDSNQLTVKDPIPNTTSASNGDVLTVDSNGNISWAAPQGGGGDSNIAFLEFTVAYNSSDEEYHLTAASMTPQEIIAAIESGKSVFARCARMWNNTIESVVQIPFSKYYNEDAYYPGSGNYNIWFGGPAGSGGAEAPYFGISHMGGSLSWESSQWGVSDIDEQ